MCHYLSDDDFLVIVAGREAHRDMDISNDTPEELARALAAIRTADAVIFAAHEQAGQEP